MKFTATVSPSFRLSGAKVAPIAFIAIACFWGTSFVAIKYVLTAFPPSFAVAIRLFIAWIFIALLFSFQGHSLRLSLKYAPKIWLTGLFAIGFPFGLLFFGMQNASAGFGGIMDGTSPIFTFIFGLLFLRRLEPFSWAKFVGLILGLLGILTIYLPVIFTEGSTGSLYSKIALLLMAMSYGIGVILTRYFFSSQNISLYANTFHQVSASFLFLAVLAFLLEDWNQIPWQAIGFNHWLALSYLGVCCTGVAWICYYYLIREWGAVKASFVAYLTPATAIAMDYWFYGNVVSLSEIIGVITILTAVLILQFYSK